MAEWRIKRIIVRGPESDRVRNGVIGLAHLRFDIAIFCVGAESRSTADWERGLLLVCGIDVLNNPACSCAYELVWCQVMIDLWYYYDDDDNAFEYNREGAPMEDEAYPDSEGTGGWSLHT
jgi:hypothetical protein